MITCTKKAPERVQASTSSCRVFADYFKTPHTNKFVFSQESRNQKRIKRYPIFQSNFAIRLIMSRLGLLCEYDYWLVEYSPIIPQKSISTNIYLCPCMDILTDSYWFQSNTLKLQRALLPHELCAQWSGWADGHYQENGEQWELGEAGASWIDSPDKRL